MGVGVRWSVGNPSEGAHVTVLWTGKASVESTPAEREHRRNLATGLLSDGNRLHVAGRADELAVVAAELWQHMLWLTGWDAARAVAALKLMDGGKSVGAALIMAGA